MHDRLVSRRIDTLHQCFLVYFRAVGTIQEYVHFSLHSRIKKANEMHIIKSVLLHPEKDAAFCSFYYSLTTNR